MKKIVYSAALALSTCVLLVFLVVSCKKKKDDACTLDCKNGGTCSNNACNCPDGYSGSTCEMYYTASYAGTYSTANGFNCTQIGSIQMSLGVTLDGSDKAKLNFGTFYGTLTDKTHFTIPSQPFGGSTLITISGSGTIDGSNLTISYTNKTSITGFETSYSCSGTLKKQ